MNELSKFFASIAALVGAVSFGWVVFNHASLVTVNLDVPNKIILVHRWWRFAFDLSRLRGSRVPNSP
jgi:hypothetical protein